MGVQPGCHALGFGEVKSAWFTRGHRQKRKAILVPLIALVSSPGEMTEFPACMASVVPCPLVGTILPIRAGFSGSWRTRPAFLKRQVVPPPAAISELWSRPGLWLLMLWVSSGRMSHPTPVYRWLKVSGDEINIETRRLWIKQKVLHNVDGLHLIRWRLHKEKTEVSRQRENSARRLPSNATVPWNQLSLGLQPALQISPRLCVSRSLTVNLSLSTHTHPISCLSLEKPLMQSPSYFPHPCKSQTTWFESSSLSLNSTLGNIISSLHKL